MVFRFLADGLVLIHLGFVVFVVAGGFVILWRPSLCWIHVPAAAWGALIEFTGWICPLTPWEQALRFRAGQVGYGGGFIDHYILPVLYPQGLTPSIQVVLGLLVVGVNVGIYAFVGYRWSRRPAVRPRIERTPSPPSLNDS